MPLATEECIDLGSCIVSGVLIHYLVNKDKITWTNAMAVVMTIIGNIFVIQPPFFMTLFHIKSTGYTKTEPMESTESYNETHVLKHVHTARHHLDFESLIGYSFGAISGITFSGYIALLKKLSHTVDDTSEDKWPALFFWPLALGLAASVIVGLVGIISR